MSGSRRVVGGKRGPSQRNPMPIEREENRAVKDARTDAPDCEQERRRKAEE